MAEDVIKIAVPAGKGCEAGGVVPVPFVTGFYSDGCPIFAPRRTSKRPPLGRGWYMPSVRGQSSWVHQRVPVIEFMVFVAGSRIPVVIAPGRLMLIPGGLPFGGAFQLGYGIAIAEMTCIQVLRQPFLLPDLYGFIVVALPIGHLGQKMAGDH